MVLVHHARLPCIVRSCPEPGDYLSFLNYLPSPDFPPPNISTLGMSVSYVNSAFDIVYL
jgi:hypothetical protein